MSDKKDLLAAVSEEHRLEVAREFDSSVSHLDNVLERLARENPRIAYFISMNSFMSLNVNIQYLSCFVYALLEKAGPLPIVSDDVAFAINADFLQAGDNYMQTLMDRISEDNPVVADSIRKYSKQCNMPTLVAASAALVYRCLESQAEADAMAKQFSLE